MADYSGFVAEADQETYQALLENYESFGVDVINAEHRQQVGQQRYQSQQNHRQDEPLLQSELTFHQNSSPIHVDICRKHALVYLVCASADSKTQEAYAQANGDVANWSGAAEERIDTPG